MTTFSNWRENFTGAATFLKRRLSSTDIPQDVDRDGDHREQVIADQKRTSNQGTEQSRKSYPSAPSSPQRSSSVQGLTRTFFAAMSGDKARANMKTILVVDEPQTDWSKYFRGKKVAGEYDIRVEQAQFEEIQLTAYSDSGVMVDIQINRQSQPVLRSFRVDFALIRQRVRNGARDFSPVLIGLQYGGVPCVNSLTSLYNFLDKPWVYTNLLEVQRRLGRQNFPLIEQVYFSSHKEMIGLQKFPAVVKVGHSFDGLGKIRAKNESDFLDVASIVGASNSYATTEPFVDAKCDLILQKIGINYKAFVRRSMGGGGWKISAGSAVLEQIAVTDKYRTWLDECSQLYGGLDVLSIQAVQAKDGSEHIVELNDSTMPLVGESQEDDRRQIADLVVHKLQTLLLIADRPKSAPATRDQPADRKPVQPTKSAGPEISNVRQTRSQSASNSPLKQNSVQPQSDGVAIQRAIPPAQAQTAQQKTPPEPAPAPAPQQPQAKNQQPQPSSQPPTPKQATQPQKSQAQPAKSQQPASKTPEQQQPQKKPQQPTMPHPQAVPPGPQVTQQPSAVRPMIPPQSGPMGSAPGATHQNRHQIPGQRPPGPPTMMAGPPRPALPRGTSLDSQAPRMPPPPVGGPLRTMGPPVGSAPSVPPQPRVVGPRQLCGNPPPPPAGAQQQAPPQPPPPRQPALRQQTLPNAQKAPHENQNQPKTGEAVDDTMKNLRKTFAGIFGDM